MCVSIWPMCVSIFIKFKSTAAVVFSRRRSSPRGRRKLAHFVGTKAAINRGRRKTRAILVLIGLDLALSACSANADYDPPSYAFSGSIHGSPISDFGYWDGWRGQSVAGIDDGQLGGHVPPPY
jgi:hypothetical protein